MIAQAEVAPGTTTAPDARALGAPAELRERRRERVSLRMSRRVNWPLWSGLALSVAAFVSYYLFFIHFPSTREYPIPTLLLFAVAIVSMVTGLRRVTGRRILAWSVTVLGVAIGVFFCLAVFVGTRILPPSAHAPAAGTKAPDFVLLDTNRKPVALSQLLAAPGNKAVILIFYRGYW
jgi:hypothetical protein